MSNPPTRAAPEVGGNNVVSMRISVDFPAPFGPSRPKISPSLTEKLIPSTAVKLLKRFVICSTSIAAIRNPCANIVDCRLVRELFPAAYRDRHERRQPWGQLPRAIVHAQPDLECLDVALGAADIALGGVIGIHAAKINRAGFFEPGRKSH